MKWFKHDSNAHTDDKIQKILMRYGADGYAIYWYCIELIASRTCPENITFELKHDAETIGYYLKIDTLKVEKIMADMVELGLFENNDNRITCLKLAKRLDNTLSQNKEIKETLRNFNSVKAEEKRLDKNRIEKSKDILATTPDEVVAQNRVPFNKIVELFHKTLPELPRTEKLTTTRKGYIRQRWIEDLNEIDHWKNFFDHVRGSPFLMGKVESTNGRPPFRASLEWLTKPANFAKVSEDRYHEEIR